ncbi:DUF4363 family protein [Clostridium botulinum]|uniref:DUF4363 family protein n=1 Tax=Clostridium botulinum C/D str. DC5 TaxID=1443128 RepID=A0A0A0IJY0_CLOBO|nr:DUF4363 family protein [Clostridium botulinum]KEI03076.1 hypothetical protein Z952_08760 [Clostridium botulinum C/D str. BKT75002]KEI13492.1 hypothetical protein Z954_07345 [Clostridium botulinum C/D str. BKT2873]KGM94228.1 hypothetical protein Z956_08265 [Clostridium botulinum D str. CCUG 7971]KGN01760.1 hypothetical protein Z955_00870 [Clostridium botulinum C/D str. DC5]KOC49305.1 hypothetical protein ADU88_06390 [Clostridium botulinum]
MNKFVKYLIPIIAIFLFIIVMLSGKFLKQPRNSSEDLVSFVYAAIKDCNSNNWSKVKTDTDNIKTSWEKIQKRIQFSVERDQLYDMAINIARARGAAIAQDKNNLIIELNEILENWNELSK